jgi:ring-1,2-phenylacetyl-CoA epoxidase subunit PaaC
MSIPSNKADSKNSSMTGLTDVLLHLADNALVLGQRNAEWCGHGPVLEQDIAITNISLDLVGQARNFYQYAAELIGNGSTEDGLAYLRTEREYKNCLLVEQPNGDWAQTMLRQFLFSAYQALLYAALENHPDQQLAAIAAKSKKEVTYHLRWSSEWVIRLGDGTGESKQRMMAAIETLWQYTGELFLPAGYEMEANINVSSFEQDWKETVKSVFDEAGLIIPVNTFMQKGGKQGIHTEHLGYILTELQYMQRAYPDSQW